MAQTARFKFNKFGGADAGSLSDDGQKFSSGDRDLLDRLLSQVEQHTHKLKPLPGAPAGGLVATLATGGGTLAAGLDYFYRFSVVDLDGSESPASPEVKVSTPDLLSAPGTPNPWTDETLVGGSLPAGGYYYALTALRGAEESPLGAMAVTTVGADAPHVTLDLPDYGAADSFRIWRMGLNDAGWTRIGLTATGNDTFVDMGAVPADPCACDPGNTPPVFNQGVSSYRVELSLPQAVDLTGKLGWRIYRTTVAGSYATASLVRQVVETQDQWDETSPIVRVFSDTGDELRTGRPSDFNQNMIFQAFTFDSGTELPAPGAYPAGYPFLLGKELYAKVDTKWELVAGGGGGGGGGMSSVLTAPDGSRYVLAVANDGTLTTQPTLFPGPPAPVQNVTVL